MASSADERAMDVDFPSEEDYEHLIEDYSHLAPPTEGELLQGHVVKVTPQEIIVDFGYKLEGLVPIEQVRQPDGIVPFKAGDPIDVMIDRSSAQPEGYVLLSFSKASRLRIWDNLERAMREQLLVSGMVTERTKGGLMVDVGVPAFMPGSQVDLRPIHDLDQFLGQDIPVKVLKINRRRGNVVHRTSAMGTYVAQIQSARHLSIQLRFPQACSRVSRKLMSGTRNGLSAIAIAATSPRASGATRRAVSTAGRQPGSPALRMNPPIPYTPTRPASAPATTAPAIRAGRRGRECDVAFSGLAVTVSLDPVSILSRSGRAAIRLAREPIMSNKLS